MSSLDAIRDTLQERARELAGATLARAERRGEPHLCFKVGPARLAVPLTAVRIVLQHQRCARIPAAPVSIAGAIHFQGSVIAVADVRQRLELGADAGGRPTKVILLESRGRLLGILAHEASDIFPIDLEQLSSFSERGSQVGDGIVRGVTPDITLVLDVARAFDELRVVQTPNPRSGS